MKLRHAGTVMMPRTALFVFAYAGAFAACVFAAPAAPPQAPAVPLVSGDNYYTQALSFPFCPSPLSKQIAITLYRKDLSHYPQMLVVALDDTFKFTRVQVCNLSRSCFDVPGATAVIRQSAPQPHAALSGTITIKNTGGTHTVNFTAPWHKELRLFCDDPLVP